MLLNFSNHASKNWNAEQVKAATQWGEIVDYPFPCVPAAADETEINRIAEDIVKNIKKCSLLLYCVRESLHFRI